MDDKVFRDQLIALLDGGNAHMRFQKAVADFPLDHINARAEAIPYSVWEVVEHMRIAQKDILDFIENTSYVELNWPGEYWPASGKEANEEIWRESINGFLNDLETLKKIVLDSGTSFTAPLPHAPKYNVLREILLVADHNSYHLGQLITLRRALQIY